MDAAHIRGKLSHAGGSLLLILCLHAGALWGLMQIDAFRDVARQVVPIMVGLIAAPEPPKPEPPPPKPKIERPKPKPQMIASEAPSESAIEAPPMEPEPEPEPEPPAPAPPAPPAPVIPPNFVAAYLNNPPPAYPDSSKRQGEEGMVMLRVRVNADGLPASVEIEKSCGYRRLDMAALDAVRRWKFVPARQGDQAVAATVLVPLNFELKRD
jgi:protein TonB